MHTVHINLSQKRSFSKTLFKPEEIKNAGFRVGGKHIRDLKIGRRDELGRLPEVNLLNRACARELSTCLSPVPASSTTPFRPVSRRIENVSSLRLFSPDNCSNRLYFQLY